MNKSTNSRLENIDALRGLCVLLVIFTHLGIFPWLAGRVAVAAFFLVSGYVIPFSVKSERPNPVRDFWLSRFFRLWPAYWVSILLAVLVASPQEFALAKPLINLTMLQGFVGAPNVIPVYWTLQIELCFYVAVTGLLLLAKTIRETHCAAISLAFSVLAFAMAAMRYASGIKLPVAIPIAMALMFFSAVFRARRIRGGSFPLTRYAFLSALLIPTCLLSYADVTNPEESSVHYVAAYFLAMGLFLTFERLRQVPKALIFLGTISYSMYLLHTPVIALILEYLPNMQPWLIAALSIILSAALAALCYIAVEKPFQRFSNPTTRASHCSIPSGKNDIRSAAFRPTSK